MGQLYPAEADTNGTAPIGVKFAVGYPVYSGTTPVTPSVTMSPSPNPYTSGPPYGVSNPAFINGQSFQIISAGLDGNFGIGGLYNASTTSATAGGALPPENGISNSTDPSVRVMENDNLTNFHNGKLN